MIRKRSSGKYDVVSEHKDPKTGKARPMGSYSTREEAVKRLQQIEYFKHKKGK